MIFLEQKRNFEGIHWINKINKKKPFVKVAILNIMPTLEVTERQLLKVLDTKFIQVKVDFIYLETFTEDSIKQEYLKKYYIPFRDIKKENYDGIIVTGAPLEHFCYEDIKYIKELNEFLNYSKSHAKSTMFLCWSSLYALYYFYGVDKYLLPKKLSGLYKQYLVEPSNLTSSFDEYFYVPQSRYCSIKEADVLNHKDLILVSKSNDSGVFLVENKSHNQVFVTGHLEYEKNTLELEYFRDLKLKIRIDEPVNYYQNGKINYCWLAHQSLFYHNWLYYYVYRINQQKYE